MSRQVAYPAVFILKLPHREEIQPLPQGYCIYFFHCAKIKIKSMKNFNAKGAKIYAKLAKVYSKIMNNPLFLRDLCGLNSVLKLIVMRRVHTRPSARGC